MAAAIATNDDETGRDFLRWSIGGGIILAAHLGVVAAYAFWHDSSEAPSGAPPIVLVELAPAPTSPDTPTDVAPGPDMDELQPPPEPEKVEEPKVEELPKVQPDVPTAVIPPPVEQKEEAKKPPTPPKPDVVKKKKPPAPRTARAPSSEAKRDRVAAAPSPGLTSAESRASEASWRAQLVAHLQRYKRYPSSAESAREQGVASLSFTMDRNGRVYPVASRIVLGFPISIARSWR